MQGRVEIRPIHHLGHKPPLVGVKDWSRPILGRRVGSRHAESILATTADAGSNMRSRESECQPSPNIAGEQPGKSVRSARAGSRPESLRCFSESTSPGPASPAARPSWERHRKWGHPKKGSFYFFVKGDRAETRMTPFLPWQEWRGDLTGRVGVSECGGGLVPGSSQRRPRWGQFKRTGWRRWRSGCCRDRRHW
jgi:hypothetical protein